MYTSIISMLLLVILHSSTMLVDGQSMDESGGGRGAGIFEKLAFFNPELRMTTEKPNPYVPKKRRVRGERWLEKFVVSVDLDLHTTPTTTTTTTTTLSPEQIQENKRIQQEKLDPKNFLKKLKQFNLLGAGNEDESRKGSDDETRSTKNLEKDVQDMHKKLHKKLEGCNDNSECFNSTCCFKEDPSKRGQCIVQPHRLDQACSQMCGCTGTYEDRELECKIMEASTDGEDGKQIKEKMQCKQISQQEFMKRILQKMKDGRNRSPRGKRTQRKRLMFV